MRIFGKKKKELGEDITNLKLGTKVEITKIEDKEYKFAHNSKLEEFLAPDEVIILTPISKGMIVRLPQNIKYTIIFKTKKGLFKNVMKIEEYFIKDGIPYMRIKLLEDTKRIQRRQCFRLETSIDFKFDIVEEKTEEVFYSDDPLLSNGRTEDISSGGMKFLSNEEVAEGDIVKIEFTLGEELIYAIGVILHSENTINKPFKYCYKMKFEMIDKEDREYLSKYIFEEQRNNSKTIKLRK